MVGACERPVTTLIANTELVVCSSETLATHPELFHYTSLDAFENIIKSNSFWASHYADMADKNEVLLMRDRLPAAIAPRFDEIVAPMNRHYRRLFHAAGGGNGVARNFVKSLYDVTFLGETRFSAIEAYMASFSTHAHDGDFERENGVPNQWTEYGGPNGVCLVLDTAKLAAYLGREMDTRYWVRLALEPVRYNDRPVDQLFPELVNASADTLQQFVQGVPYPEMAVPEFLSGATLLKSAKYKSEREIRIVAIPGTKRLSDRAVKEHPSEFNPMPLPEIRSRTDGRRYISIFEPLGITLPLKRVIIGPSAWQAQNALIVQSLLREVPIFLSICDQSVSTV